MYKRIQFDPAYAKSVTESAFISHVKKERPGIEEHVDLKAIYAELTGKTATKQEEKAKSSQETDSMKEEPKK